MRRRRWMSSTWARMRTCWAGATRAGRRSKLSGAAGAARRRVRGAIRTRRVRAAARARRSGQTMARESSRLSARHAPPSRGSRPTPRSTRPSCSNRSRASRCRQPSSWRRRPGPPPISQPSRRGWGMWWVCWETSPRAGSRRSTGPTTWRCWRRTCRYATGTMANWWICFCSSSPPPKRSSSSRPPKSRGLSPFAPTHSRRGAENWRRR
mmetsp:Transcript_31446/g.101706  ORF Transcript_31446/g.101706 Transcript_31446/m.101706 type:complete len:209 (+) Transcript_31446:379-1005(+)